MGGRDGIYPPLAIFSERQSSRKVKSQLSPHVWPEIPPLQILPLLSVALGPRTSDLSLLPSFLHLYNEDQDTCLCYTISVTIH